MHTKLFQKLVKGFSIFWKNFLSAYPVIIFFVVLFLITVSMFSLQYAMVVSIFTTMFNIQRRRQNSIGNFIKIFFISIFLCLLAFLTTVNPVYCLILNFCIPFLLVFLQSSRFNPKGYFSYAMLFIFLELMPVPASELPRELTAVMFSVGFLVAALVLYTLIFHPSSKKELDIRFGLKELADVLEQLAEGNADYKTRGRLLDLEHKFHLTAYNNHKFIPVHNSHTKLYDMFSILFQRAAYLVHDTTWRSEIDEEHIRELQELADFLHHASQQINTANNDALIRQARTFLNEMKDADGRLRIFFRSFLHMLILIFIYYFKNILSINDIQTLLEPITKKYFHSENGFSISELYQEIFELERSEVSTVREDVIKTFDAARISFTDAPEEDKDFLQMFSFICMLSFDVYLKKQLIEELIDKINQGKENA